MIPITPIFKVPCPIMKKNYRILKVCSANSNEIEEYYRNNNFEQLDYEEQIKQFQAANIILPGSWSGCMEKLGNECTDVLVNATSMQQQWCMAKGLDIDFSKKDWMYRILREHISDYKPDILFFYDSVFTWFSERQRKELRDDFPFLKFITGLWGDELSGHPSYSKAFANADLVFTSTALYRDMFTTAGIPAHVLGNCFDHFVASVESKPGESRDSHHLTFVGSTGFGCDQHRQRYLNLLAMMQRTDLKAWTHERNLKQRTINARSPASMVKTPMKWIGKRSLNLLSTHQLETMKEHRLMNWKIAKYIDETITIRNGRSIRGEYFLDKQKISELFPDRCRPFLEYASDYFEVLQQSKYVFNTHRDELADGPNIRVFEATGMGSCLITDRGNEMKEFFVPDKELVTYDTVDEAIEKIEYLDCHEDERAEIARAGQKRTLTDHTIVNRCEKIHEIVSGLI